MKKTIDTLVSDIYGLFTDGHESSQEGVKDLGERVGSAVSAALARNLTTRQPTLRLSNVGKPCTRQLWYELKGVEGEPMLPHTLVKFLFGNILEELLLFLASEAGHTVSHRQHQVTVDGVKGHIDALIDGVLVDSKSTSPYGFKKFKDGGLKDDDAFGYQGQLTGYRVAMEKDEAFFFAIDKQNGSIGLFRLESDYSIEDQIAKVRSALDSDEPPVRAFDPVPEGKSGNMKLTTPCNYCAFKKACYPSVRKFLYANGPVYLTHVERAPNVREVEI